MRLSFNQKNHNHGFTLLELLVVVLIVGILATAGIGLINSQSEERQLQSEGEQLIARLNHLCERSILENRAHGVEWGESGVQVLRHASGQWQPLETQWQSAFDETILINAVMADTEQAWQQQPHVICQSDGSISEFEWRVAGLGESASEFRVRVTDPWTMQGGWHEDN